LALLAGTAVAGVAVLATGAGVEAQPANNRTDAVNVARAPIWGLRKITSGKMDGKKGDALGMFVLLRTNE
jgi:hypothetical protein